VEEGKLVASGTVQEIHARLRPHHQVRVVFFDPQAEAVSSGEQPSVSEPAKQGVSPADAPSSSSLDDAHAWLVNHPRVMSVELQDPGNPNGSPTTQKTRDTLWVTLDGTQEVMVHLLAELVEAGFPVLSYTEERETLESMFLNLTRGIVS
jgi:ABC-type multidrug transport system ATPase subunit